jgi:two-component system OmpR family sensor kinase
MSGIASWTRSHRTETAWGAFALANFVALFWLLDYQTVPFHFVWVSLTLLYGARVWGMTVTLAVLACVCTASAVTLGYAVSRDATGIDELTEIPLMTAMFMVMVWYARRREAALAEARRAAERESDFIRDASHQLKTPIAIARGLADLLRESEPSDERRLDLDDLAEELDRLGAIAEGLLLIEVAQLPGTFERQPVEVEDLVVSAIRRWSHGARRDWLVDADLEGVLAGDRQRLDAALDAVLENAVQATDESDTISVAAIADDGNAVIAVADTGTGIAPDLLPRIFERFSRGRTVGGTPGTGLGLAIAKAIVDAHGGSIGARSVPGHGTTIILRLPGLEAAAPLEPPAGEPEPALGP